VGLEDPTVSSKRRSVMIIEDFYVANKFLLSSKSSITCNVYYKSSHGAMILDFP
jgi:hypothetical protein